MPSSHNRCSITVCSALRFGHLYSDPQDATVPRSSQNDSDSAGFELHRDRRFYPRSGSTMSSTKVRPERTFDRKCARRDCSRLRRSSSASLRTAAAEAATYYPARRRVVEPSCCPSGIRSACPISWPRLPKNFFGKNVRPKGFEPLTPWFEDAYSKQRKVSTPASTSFPG